jgi:hypothetical protein
MWDIARRFLKMGMLKLESHTGQKFETSDEPAVAEIGQNRHPANKPRSQTAPKLTGFAARREQAISSTSE